MESSSDESSSTESSSDESSSTESSSDEGNSNEILSEAAEEETENSAEGEENGTPRRVNVFKKMWLDNMIKASKGIYKDED
jgi:hypothetical protein